MLYTTCIKLDLPFSPPIFFKQVTGPITRAYLIKIDVFFYPLCCFYCLINLVQMSKVQSSPIKPPQIIPFLRALLDDDSKKNIICWTNKSKLEFLLSNPHKVAELWGLTKPGRKTKVMNYNNMSRLLRKCCKNNLLEKIYSRFYEYRFVDPDAPVETTKRPLLFGIDRILCSENRTLRSSNQIQMLPFLHGLLGDPSNKDIICWTNKTNQEFRIRNTKKIGKLWGLTKPAGAVMGYESVYHSLRRHCKNGMLEKMEFRNLEYRFLNSSSSDEFKKPILFSVERILSSDFGRSI
ncbi:hypothetical protein L5515_006142 [Caenorhabditis briggsae]|uniref:ETS domain-containing protein n=3 Tax=Caenorhabditis briggsae TaxID=6238 RepID=A0AAE9JJ55_CAEBR|nr:hypothetical protein L5515_006142 [Caenorhabditis briggsae]